MKEYTFTIKIEGLGDTPDEAWEDAMIKIIQNPPLEIPSSSTYTSEDLE
jgi:hypothetical protein